MHNTSVDIFESKKEALENGDKALSNQVGQGKDIMSILSEYLQLCYVASEARAADIYT